MSVLRSAMVGAIQCGRPVKQPGILSAHYLSFGRVGTVSPSAPKQKREYVCNSNFFDDAERLLTGWLADCLVA